MFDNIFKNKSKFMKIVHIILFIITALYLLESIFIRGLFSNVMLACVNIALSIFTIILSLIKKDYKLAVIDFIIFILTSSIFMYLIYM